MTNEPAEVPAVKSGETRNVRWFKEASFTDDQLYEAVRKYAWGEQVLVGRWCETRTFGVMTPKGPIQQDVPVQRIWFGVRSNLLGDAPKWFWFNLLLDVDTDEKQMTRFVVQALDALRAMRAQANNGLKKGKL